MSTITELENAALTFFELVQKKEFQRTLRLNKEGERRLLPLFGAFLAGKFGDVQRETEIRLGGSKRGRLDFLVCNSVAVELAVRKPKLSFAPLSSTVNATEAKKLLKHDGLAALVLLDFSKKPLSNDQIERFREWPSLGKGNHALSAFNVIYCFKDQDGPRTIKKNIRIG